MNLEQRPTEGLIGEVVEVKGMRLKVIGATEREITLRLLSFDESARPTNADLTEMLAQLMVGSPK